MVKCVCLFVDGKEHLERESRQLDIHRFATVLLGIFVLYFILVNLITVVTLQLHVIKIVSHCLHVGGFLLVLWFHAPKKYHDRISYQSTTIDGLNPST